MSKLVKIARKKMERKIPNFLFSLILLFIVGICWFCTVFPSTTIIEPKTGTDYFHYHESFD